MLIPLTVKDFLRLALEEDIGNSDLTTALLVPDDQKSRALIVAKGNFLVAGLPFFKEIFQIVEPGAEFKIFFGDGSKVRKSDIIAEVYAKTVTILSCERVGLNILQRLSGIATLTSSYVEKVKGTAARIVDTRKTTPGMRFLEKYAVKVGGGRNHRFGLYDGILIKDNHIEAAGGITNAVNKAKGGHHLSRIEVEVENLNDLKKALSAGADVVMLDNMSVKDMKEAVETVKGRAVIEASGNVSLDKVRAIAETGVDLISVGALTHSAAAADISLKIVR